MEAAQAAVAAIRAKAEAKTKAVEAEAKAKAGAVLPGAKAMAKAKAGAVAQSESVKAEPHATDAAAAGIAEKADAATEKGKFDAKKWARFQRSQHSDGQRSSRTNKCPPAIAQRIRAANPTEVKEWFTMYCDCETDWAIVELTVKTLEKDSCSDLSELEWYTEQDLMEKHHHNRPMVDAIKKQKQRDDKTWRPHPDCPELESSNQYLCLRFERRRKEHEESSEKALSLSSELSAPATKSILPMFPGGTSSALFARGPSESNGQSVSDSKAATKDKEKREKQEKDKEDKKREKEKPLNKLSKAATIAQSEMGKMSSWVDDVEHSKVNSDTKKMFKDKFNKHVKDMKSFKTKCLTTAEEADAVELLDKQPIMQEAAKKDIAAWKRIAKTFGNL